MTPEVENALVLFLTQMKDSAKEDMDLTSQGSFSRHYFQGKVAALEQAIQGIQNYLYIPAEEGSRLANPSDLNTDGDVKSDNLTGRAA